MTTMGQHLTKKGYCKCVNTTQNISSYSAVGYRCTQNEKLFFYVMNSLMGLLNYFFLFNGQCSLIVSTLFPQLNSGKDEYYQGDLWCLQESLIC